MIIYFSPSMNELILQTLEYGLCRYIDFAENTYDAHSAMGFFGDLEYVGRL